MLPRSLVTLLPRQYYIRLVSRALCLSLLEIPQLDLKSPKIDGLMSRMMRPFCISDPQLTHYRSVHLCFLAFCRIRRVWRNIPTPYHLPCSYPIVFCLIKAAILENEVIFVGLVFLHGRRLKSNYPSPIPSWCSGLSLCYLLEAGI